MTWARFFGAGQHEVAATTSQVSDENGNTIGARTPDQKLFMAQIGLFSTAARTPGQTSRG